MKAAGFVVALCLLLQSQAFAQDPDQKAQASQHSGAVEQNLPSLPRKFSYPTGVFSTLNISLENINVATSVVVSADAAGNPVKVRDIRTDYTMKLAAYRQTTVHFYPRNYAAK